MSQVQRKQGVGGLFRPVSWNKGRRFTSPGPDLHNVPRSTNLQNYEGPLMRLQIEAFLDDNPEFTESYVLRKVGRKTIESWHKLHSGTDTDTPLLIVQDASLVRKKSEETSYSSQIRKRFSDDKSPSIRRSVSVTPNRKISASIFEASGLSSAILTTAADGSSSFLTPNSAIDLTRQRSKSVILEGEQRTITEVTSTMISDLDLSSLCMKIAQHLLFFSRGVGCTVALPRDGLKKGYKVEASNVRQEENGEGRAVTFKNYFELDNQTISLLSSGRLVYLTPCSNVLQPPSQAGAPPLAKIQTSPLEFPPSQPRTKYPSFNHTQVRGPTLLNQGQDVVYLLPLRDVQSELQGLAAIQGRDMMELQNNLVLSDLSRICGICLKNATEHNSAKLEVTRSQVFLDLARVIFDEQTSIEFTVLKILVNFINLIECEIAQVMLYSPECPTKFHKVYDLEEDDLRKPGFKNLKAPFENRFPINSSIAGLVAATGETVSIGDLSSDSRFDNRLNGDVSFEHRSLLCMPILDSDRKILGVISLINKKVGEFSSNDERFVEAFGIFCGIALRNVSQYELAREAEARCQVALEIMAYHADSDPKEAEELAELPVPSALSLHLQSLAFSDADLRDLDTLRSCLRMFYELDLVSRFGLEHGTLCRWLLTVKKNYRMEVLYHNWNHAFNVAQVMFACLLNSGWWSGLGPTSCLGLLIACLSHDLDHRGTNNSYQLATDSPLAVLYSTSTLERHHLNQTLVLLNLQDNRILANLTASEYSETLAIIEESILATDLALHFSHLSKLTDLASKGPTGVNWTDSSVVKIIRSALMTASDLGGSTKPWEVQKEIAGLIAEEFWQQGDLERERLSAPSQPLMDRELRDTFPQLQVGFCEGVCLPVYSALTALCPSLSPLQEGVLRNRNRWLAKGGEDEEEGSEEKEDRASDEDKTVDVGSEINKITRNL